MMQSLNEVGVPFSAMEILMGSILTTSSSATRSPVTQTFDPPSTMLLCVCLALMRWIQDIESPQRPQMQVVQTMCVTLSVINGREDTLQGVIPVLGPS